MAFRTSTTERGLVPIPFRVLRRSPIVGRDFVSSDEAPGATPVTILSYHLWERRYGKDPAVIGQTVRLNGAATMVIASWTETLISHTIAWICGCHWRQPRISKSDRTACSSSS